MRVKQLFGLFFVICMIAFTTTPVQTILVKQSPLIDPTALASATTTMVPPFATSLESYDKDVYGLAQGHAMTSCYMSTGSLHLWTWSTAFIGGSASYAEGWMKDSFTAEHTGQHKIKYFYYLYGEYGIDVTFASAGLEVKAITNLYERGGNQIDYYEEIILKKETHILLQERDYIYQNVIIERYVDLIGGKTYEWGASIKQWTIATSATDSAAAEVFLGPTTEDPDYTVNILSVSITPLINSVFLSSDIAGGTISFDDTTYSDLPTTVWKESGHYTGTANPPDGYIFDEWETTGGISVTSATSYTTTVIVDDDGTLEAKFKIPLPSNAWKCKASWQTDVELPYSVSSSSGEYTIQLKDWSSRFLKMDVYKDGSLVASDQWIEQDEFKYFDSEKCVVYAYYIGSFDPSWFLYVGESTDEASLSPSQAQASPAIFRTITPLLGSSQYVIGYPDLPEEWNPIPYSGYKFSGGTKDIAIEVPSEYPPKSREIIITFTESPVTDGSTNNYFFSPTVIWFPPLYTVTIETSGLSSSSYVTHVFIDDEDQGPSYIYDGNSRSFTFNIGTSHTIEVDQHVVGSEGIRFVCDSHSQAVSFDTVITFTYNKQCQFSVMPYLPDTVSFTFKFGTSSPPMDIESVTGSSTWTSEWYNEGTQIYIDIDPSSQVISDPSRDGMQYVFHSWNDLSPITLYGYVTLKAFYKTHFLLTIKTSGLYSTVGKTAIYLDGEAVADDFGVSTINDESTDGWRKWFNSGTQVEVDIDSPIDSTAFFNDWVFDGTSTSNAQPLSITINSPHTITARYTSARAYFFDFGTSSSPVEAGYVRITEVTAYSVSLGYGWTSTAGLRSRDRGAPDDLRRDFVFSSTDHTFTVDVADGTYTVTLIIGDWSYMHDKIDVYAEGILVDDDLTAAKGTFPTTVFTVTGNDGQLNIRFHDDGGTDRNWVINALTLEPAGPIPLSVFISPTSVSMVVGQSQTFTAAAFGGTAPYSYEWYLDGIPVSGATASTWRFSGAGYGTYEVYVVVTDGVGDTAQSNTATVTVTTQLAAFDFGTSSSPVEAGYVRVTEVTAYSVSLGYGWTSTTGLVSRDRGAPDSLRRDFVFDSTDHTFTVDVADGTYTVTLIIGDQNYMHDLIDVYAEGNIKINDLTVAAGEFQEVTFTVTVTDGELNFRFHDDGGTDRNWVINALKLGIVPGTLFVSIDPTSVFLVFGDGQTFTSSVSGGTSPYTYQWYLDGIPVPGATASTWRFPGAGYGTYEVYVVVTDGVGDTAKSNTATVNVVNFNPDFDFGTSSSPVFGGKVRVTESTAYPTFWGYGWSSTAGLRSRDRGATTSTWSDYERDFVFDSTDHTFNVYLLPWEDLEKNIAVGITIGDKNYMHDRIDVYVEDTLVIDDLTVAAGTFEHIFLHVIIPADDDQLNIRFHDDGGSDANWVVNRIVVAWWD